MRKWMLALLAALLTVCAACAAQPPQALLSAAQAPSEPAKTAPSWQELTFDEPAALSYATQFTICRDKRGYTRLTIGDDQTFLLVPEDAAVPEDVPADVTVPQQPCSITSTCRNGGHGLFPRARRGRQDHAQQPEGKGLVYRRGEGRDAGRGHGLRRKIFRARL